MRKYRGTWARAFLLSLCVLSAQERPAFEVASVRAHSGGDGAFSIDIADSGRLTARNMTVWNLIRQAFGWRDLQMTGGPPWIKTDGFDVVAEAGQSAPVERSRVKNMLQVLPEDRFRLRWHEQVRETAGYALRVASGGPKLAPAKDGPGRTRMGDLSDPHMSLDSLCQILEFDLAKPVVDQTGLSGTYAIQLQWARMNPSAAQDPDTSKPSLFTAVQE
jgi:uncharacterized protein (TIGR03435 family)